jgi:hypothetical protein
MRTRRDRPTLLKALNDVSEQLASPNLTAKERLPLLRRQAELVDLREELALRARRQAR